MLAGLALALAGQGAWAGQASGGEILFGSDRESGHHLYLMATDGTGAHRLTGTLKLLGMLDHPSIGINPWLYYDPRRNVRIAGSLYTYVGAARSAFNNVSIGAFTELRYSF